MCRRFEETEAKLAALQRQREKLKADAIAIGGMMFELGELDALPLTFDEKLWNGTVDHVTVHADERVVFRFRDGNSKNRLGTAEKDSAAPGLFYFVLSVLFVPWV